MSTSLPARFVLLLALLALPISLAACGGGGGGGGVAPGGQLGVAPTETLVVTNLDDSGPGSLRQAVLDAIPGAWIVFDPALPTGAIALGNAIEIHVPLAIGGLAGDGGRMEIDGGGLWRLFDVQPGAHLWLNDIVLTNGDGVDGGAIRAEEAQVTVWRTQFAGHTGNFGSGGAIHVADSQLRVYDSSFVANNADDGGAINARNSDVRIERTSFFLNSALAGTGCAYNAEGSNTVIVNSSFLGNMANSGFGEGGAIRVRALNPGDHAILRIYSSTITGNTSGDVGGGIAVVEAAMATAEFEIYRSIVAENTATSTNPDLIIDSDATVASQQNLIGIGDSAFFWDGLDQNQVGDAITPLDPLLGPTVGDPTGRMMRVPLELSPATGAVAGPVLGPDGQHLFFDQRGQIRDPAQGNELGAIERGP